MIADDLDLAAREVEAGRAVGLPTDTVYGLGARPEDPSALFGLKGRPDRVPLPVLVATPDDAAALCAGDVSRLRALAEAFWPGALTVVVPLLGDRRFSLGGDGQTVGVRVPAHPLARALLERTGPLAVTSANRHGAPPATSAAEVVAIFGPDLVCLDGGTCAGAPSTVCALTADGFELLREGPVTAAAVERALRR